MQRAVLNVGGGTKAIAIPPHFDGWRHDLLDILNPMASSRFSSPIFSP
jgi:hypothetical protein